MKNINFSNLSDYRIESNRNFFARIGMLYRAAEWGGEGVSG